MSSNQMRLDGIAVESHAGRFAGTFDIEDSVGETLTLGDMGYAVVSFNIDAPSFKTDSSGDLKRIHVFGTEDFHVVPRSLWNKLLDMMDEADDQQRLFSRVEEEEETATVVAVDTVSGAAGVNTDTGEVVPEEVAAPVTRIGQPAGSQDPVLRKFYEETNV